MKVLVIPEDQTLDGYIVKPVITALFDDLGYRASIDVLPEPRLRGAGDALDKELIASIVRDNPMIDLFLLVVDRDCDRFGNSRKALERQSEHATKLIACVAKEEVEVWLLALHADRLPVPLKVVRAHCDPKEVWAGAAPRVARASWTRRRPEARDARAHRLVAEPEGSVRRAEAAAGGRSSVARSAKLSRSPAASPLQAVPAEDIRMPKTAALLIATLPLVVTACSVEETRAGARAIGGGPSARAGGEPPAFSPDRARGQLGRAMCARAAEACVAEADETEERLCGMVAAAALEDWSAPCVLVASDALGACLVDVSQSGCNELTMLPPTCDPNLLCADAPVPSGT